MRKLTPDIVEQIYFFTGSPKELYEKFGCSIRVAKRIKYGESYTEITQYFDDAGEIVIHKLTWDDVCFIRGSDLSASHLASQYKVTKETIYNILNGKTRIYK
jgi:hypothetical protein